MNKRSPWLTAALWALASGAALAAPEVPRAPASGQRTLANALESAVRNRVGMRIAGAEVQIAQARARQSEAPFYPTLNWVTNFDRIESFDTFSGITASAVIPSLNASANISVSQSVPRYQASSGLLVRYDLYAGGRDQAQLDKQQLALEATQLSQRIVLQGIARDVSLKYFRLRRMCAEVEIDKRNALRAQETAGDAQQRFDKGLISDIENKAQTLAFTESRASLRAKLEELDMAHAEFLVAVYENAPPADASKKRCRFDQSIEADMDQARSISDSSLENQFHNLNKQVAEKAVAVERSAFKPQVSLYAAYTGIGRSDSSFRDGASDFSRRQASIGLQISYNLFDHGLTRNRVSEGQSEVQRRALLAEQAANELEQSGRRSDAQVRMAQNRVELLQARVAHASALSNLARERLKTGTGTALAANEQADRELNLQQELEVSKLDLSIAQIERLFPVRSTADAGPSK